jgi:hypothetical protein
MLAALARAGASVAALRAGAVIVGRSDDRVRRHRAARHRSHTICGAPGGSSGGSAAVAAGMVSGARHR